MDDITRLAQWLERQIVEIEAKGVYTQQESGYVSALKDVQTKVEQIQIESL